jgi:hypothetical protein
MVRDVCAEAELTALLQEAFPPVPLDAEKAVGGNNTATFFTGNDQAASLKQLVEGNTWLSLDIDLLDPHHDILFFLQPRQFAALLPAFLRAAVTRFKEFEPLVDLLSFLLTRDPSKPAEFDHRISALSSSQRTAVSSSVQCLVILCEAWPSNPTRAVYESYWSTQTLPKEERNEQSS